MAGRNQAATTNVVGDFWNSAWKYFGLGSAAVQKEMKKEELADEADATTEASAKAPATKDFPDYMSAATKKMNAKRIGDVDAKKEFFSGK